MKCNSLLKLIFRHTINCIAFSLQIQSSHTARRIALTLETKNFSPALFYADTKTPHGEKNCSAKSKSFLFSNPFLLTRILFGLTKNPHGKKNRSLVFAKSKSFFHACLILCNYKESTRREELRCSLLKYKFFPRLIRGHKFKDSTQ